MANLKELTLKIASLKNTKKITRAMKMIAATKLRRAQQAVENSEAYAANLNEVMGEAVKSTDMEHPLTVARESVKTVAILAFSSDRGLCGGYNNNIIKKTQAAINEATAAGKKVVLLTAGKRCNTHFQKHFADGVKTFYELAMAEPGFAHADDMAEALINLFESGEADECVLIYNKFESAISQVPSNEVLLPATVDSDDDAAPANIIFEPSASDILSDVVVRAVKFQVFRVLLNAVASEHAARMTAMDNAVNNSDDMIDKYTLQRNRARQAAITTELTEIVAGAEAV